LQQPAPEPALNGFTRSFGRVLETALQRLVERSKAPGVQYVHVSGDSVLFRFQAGLADVARGEAVTRATTFNGFSVTKTFTAVAVLQLAENGLVQLDAPAATYLPDFPYPHGISVRNLLTHSAGIPNPIPLRWVHLAEAHGTFDRNAFFRAEYARHPEVKAAPNARFGYSNLGYELLGEIIEAVSGTSYEEYVTRNIIDRIGIPSSELGFTIDASRHAVGYHRRLSFTYPILGFLIDRKTVLGDVTNGWHAFRSYYMNGAAYGGLVGTAEGFARYLQALLKPDSGVLSAESRAILFTENVLSSGKRSGVALAWFSGVLDGEPFFDHAGGGGGYYAEIRLYPGIGRGSVLLMNRTGMKNDRVLNDIDREWVSVHRAPVPDE
jgi:CubicO group peptidase (beta-lactamase class C family)